MTRPVAGGAGVGQFVPTGTDAYVRLVFLRPGDPVLIQDAGGRYRPDPRADWHLLAGDETALPATAVTVAATAPESGRWL
uniref:Uncharacterized protein n=1 Tax=uncultured bacterium esnapd15 TaxID=1366595 RepID=S5TMZ6_9BACT|nr:hypothetical protein [uncultured bacterium esnapd15]